MTEFSDFYSVVAQILPVILLAFLWESGFLDRLRGQRRANRADDPRGVRFWTKPRVRAYNLVVATIAISAIAAGVLVLGGIVADAPLLRWLVSSAVVVTLGTLLFRMLVDIVGATGQADGE